MSVIASAPGKIILSGEHAVVYGYPALVTAVDSRARIEIKKIGNGLEFNPHPAKGILSRCLKNCEKVLGGEHSGISIKLNSDIPIKCGMGSSAGVSVAAAAALMQSKFAKITLRKVSDVAYETEKFYHANSSGVDIAISTYGGLLWYRKEASTLRLFSRLKSVRSIPQFTLVNTGQPNESTADMVMSVSEIYKIHPKKISTTFRNIEKITKGLLLYILGEEDTSLIELIRENEKLLEEIGVVSDSTKKIVREIEKIGGAAKISGAGGKKGNSGVLLIYHPNLETITAFINKKKLNIIKANLGAKGVRIEKSNKI